MIVPSVIVSYGMGVDSTALLVRLLTEPHLRDFDVSQLVVLSAQTGNEWPETGRLVEQHLYPLLAREGVRTVQVARAGSSQRHGIAVLDDSRTPAVCHIGGVYTLAQEMISAATVPQVGGARLCSVKSKGEPLDEWISAAVDGQPFRHLMGFEASEIRRIDRDRALGLPGRIPVYPLLEWGWDRAMCEDYLLKQLGAKWIKSACSFCPFSMTNRAGLARTLDRYVAQPEHAMLPLLMEHLALAANPRQGLIAGERLVDALQARGATEVLNAFRAHLDQQPWALYDVRRVWFRERSVVRSITMIADGPRQELLTQLAALAQQHAVPFNQAETHPRLTLTARSSRYPCLEHDIALAPALIPDKVNPRFAKAWARVLRGEVQMSLPVN